MTKIPKEYVLMNKVNGQCGLGIKLLVPQEVCVGKYSISVTNDEHFVWAIRSDEDQPYVVIFNARVMDQLENIGEL